MFSLRWMQSLWSSLTSSLYRGRLCLKMKSFASQTDSHSTRASTVPTWLLMKRTLSHLVWSGDLATGGKKHFTLIIGVGITDGVLLRCCFFNAAPECLHFVVVQPLIDLSVPAVCCPSTLYLSSTAEVFALSATCLLELVWQGIRRSLEVLHGAPVSLNDSETPCRWRILDVLAGTSNHTS